MYSAGSSSCGAIVVEHRAVTLHVDASRSAVNRPYCARWQEIDSAAHRAPSIYLDIWMPDRLTANSRADGAPTLAASSRRRRAARHARGRRAAADRARERQARVAGLALERMAVAFDGCSSARRRVPAKPPSWLAEGWSDAAARAAARASAAGGRLRCVAGARRAGRRPGAGRAPAAGRARARPVADRRRADRRSDRSEEGRPGGAQAGGRGTAPRRPVVGELVLLLRPASLP